MFGIFFILFFNLSLFYLFYPKFSIDTCFFFSLSTCYISYSLVVLRRNVLQLLLANNIACLLCGSIYHNKF